MFPLQIMIRIRQIACTGLVIAIVVGADAPASVAQSSEPLPAPLDREIGPEHADSTCIGEATTPLCATETFIACWARREIDLCRRVYDGPLTHFNDPDAKPHTFRYRLAEIGRSADENRLPPEARLAFPWAEDDMVHVSVTRSVEPERNDITKVDRVFFLAPTGNGWRIVHWLAFPVTDSLGLERTTARRVETDVSPTPACASEGPDSPACAIEEFIQCRIRETALCPEAARLPPDSDIPQLTAVEYAEFGYYRYRPEDIPDGLYLGLIKLQPDDIFFGTLETWMARDEVVLDWWPKHYLLRPGPDGWILLHWGRN